MGDPATGRTAPAVAVPVAVPPAVPVEVPLAPVTAPERWSDADGLVAALFEQEGARLARTARLLVDDRTAAEDLVQEAFIRLARSVHRIRDREKAAAYLRSIVLNLARDHNRRGLVSLRHRPPSDAAPPSVEDEVTSHENRHELTLALRGLPRRQRDAVVLRYYLELPVPEIAETLGLSVNSVKTHLRRGLHALQTTLEGSR